MKTLALTLALFSSFLTLATEVECRGRIFNFSIRNTGDILVGQVSMAGNLVDQIQMKQSVLDKDQKNSLDFKFEGETSTDSYGLYMFKEKENGQNISFLLIRSNLGHKKSIEMYCQKL